MDSRLNCRDKDPFSNFCGVAWTMPRWPGSTVLIPRALIVCMAIEKAYFLAVYQRNNDPFSCCRVQVRESWAGRTEEKNL